MNTGALVAIVTVVGTLILCAIIAWFIFRNMRKQAYTGEVVDKRTQEIEGAQDFTSTSYALIVKTDDGQQKTVRVGKKIWDQFNVGDRIVKEAGKLNPTKA